MNPKLNEMQNVRAALSGPDSFDLKGKKEQRAKLLKQAESMQNSADASGRDMTADERQKFDRVYRDFNTLSAEIRQAEKQHPARLNEGGNVSSENVWYDKSGKEIRVHNKNDKFSEAKPDITLGQCLKTMATGQGTTEIKNALKEGSDSSGGYTVPSDTLSDFVDKMRAKSRVTQAGARMISLSTDSTTIARVASDPTAEWKAEAAESSPTDLTFEGATFEPKTLRFIVKASRELMADSLNMEQVLESVFAGTTAAAVDSGILFGSGEGAQIAGLTTYSINEVDQGTNGAALTNYDPLVQAYRMMLDDNSASPNAFIMAPREWETLATLKDSQNRYLDRPQALEGIPFLETTNVPVDESHGTASDASRIITGNWNDLVIGTRWDMRIETLRERYATTYEVGFLVHMRVDALPARTGSFAQITGIIPASGS